MDEPQDPRLRQLAGLDDAPADQPLFKTPEMNALGVHAGVFSDPKTAATAALSARLPWEDVADKFPEQLAQPYQNELRLEQERDRFKGAQESTQGFITRRMAPFVSAVHNVREEQGYADAVKRFREGKPEEGDYAKIAGYERLQQIEKERSTGESVGAAVAHIPAILGEGWVAGKAFGAVAKAVRGTAEVAPLAAGETVSTLSKVGGFAGRVTATTPFMPSMYLAEAGKRAAQQGGDWRDAKNFAPAYGMGMAQVAVLGSLQRFVTEGSFARKVLGKTALGMAEQQAVDVGVQGLSDAVLNKAWKVETGYGLAGDVFRAAAGKENSAVKHVLSQAAVFGIFSAMHAGGKEGTSRDKAVERGAEIPSEVAAEIAKMKAAGFDKLAEQKAAEFGAKLEDLSTNTQRWESGPTKEAATEALKDVPEEFRPVAKKIIDSLPTLEEVIANTGRGAREAADRTTLEGVLARTAKSEAEQRKRAGLKVQAESKEILARRDAADAELASRRAEEAFDKFADEDVVEFAESSGWKPKDADGREQAVKFLVGRGVKPELLGLFREPGRRSPTLEVAPAPKPETPAPKGVEPVPDAPVPIDVLGILGEDAVRAIAAPALGLRKNAKLGDILNGIANAPKLRALLDAAARKASEKPTPPQTALGGLRTGERPQEPQTPTDGADRPVDVTGETPQHPTLGVESATQALVHVPGQGRGDTLPPVTPTAPFIPEPWAKAPQGAKLGLQDVATANAAGKVRGLKPSVEAAPEKLKDVGPEPEVDAVPDSVPEPVDRAQLATALESPLAGRLDDRERFVIDQLAAGRSQGDIGADPTFLKFTGLPADGKNRRQLVATVQKAARGKLGIEQTASALQAKDAADRVQKIATGEVDVGEMSFAPEEIGVVKRTLSVKERATAELDRITAEYEKLAEEARKRGTIVDPAREAEITQRATELAAVLAGRVAPASRKPAELPEGSRATEEASPAPGGAGQTRVTGRTPSSEDIPLSRGNSAPPSQHPTLGVDVVTPARLNAEVAAEFSRITGAKDYRAEPKVPGGANARADLRQRATTTSKFADQDPFVTLEEAAHHLAWNNDNGIETNPAKLPAEVVRGMDELNAEFGQKYKGPRAIVEGYASWAKLHAAGMTAKLTGDAKAAAEWAEKWTRDNNLMGPIDVVTPLFTKYHAQDPTQRAQGYGSSTGLPIEVPRTSGEVSIDLGRRFLDDIDNNLYPAERFEAEIRKAGGKVDPEKALSTVMAAARTGNAAGRAAIWARDGMQVMTEDGRMQKAGPSVAEIEAGAKPEWLAPGPDGSASKAGAYHTARGVVSMQKKGYEMRDEARTAMEDATQARDSQTGALREALTKEVARRRKVFEETLKETEPMIHRVSEEQFSVYEKALARWNAEPEFGEWARGYAERQTAAFNAQLELMASIGEKSKADTQRWKIMFPDYTPTERVLGADEGWNVKVPGKKGEKAPNLSRQASGSGEAIVDPRLVYQQRLLKFAEVFNRNRMFRALYELENQPGAGRFVQAYEREAGTRTDKGLEKSEELRKAGLSGDQIGRALKDMEIADSEVYFRHEPWPEDGRKATIEGMVDGELTSLRVGDRSLYDLVTNQQVDAHQTARLIRSIAQMEVLGVKPVQAQAQVVRTLATSASAAFQIKNIARDALTFWRNTTDRASVGQLAGEYWKMAGRFAREFSFNLGTKFGKDAERPRAAEDPLWEAFRDARGDQLKQFAFERDNPEKSFQGVKSTPNVGSLVKDALNWLGSPELAPRFLEYKNNIERLTGRTQERLRTEYDAYYKDLKSGRKATDPLTEGQKALLLNAAWEVTAPFPRQGTVTREFNKITPFFGPAVAGVSKAIRNWKTNPKGALYALGLVAGLRALHWALVKDESWYDQLSANDKFNNFVVPTPFGPRRLPGPRDLDVAFGGTLVAALDAANGKDPRFKQLLEQSTEAVLPPGIGPAVGDVIKGDVGMAAARLGAMPAGPVGTVGVEMMMNRDWTGKPIVPRREEGKTSGLDQFTDHYGPYALKQLTGGRGELSLAGAGLNLVPRVQNLRESVDRMYDRIHELEVERVKATRAGLRFPQEAEWDRLQAAKKQVEALAQQGRGERKVGTRVITGEKPEAEVKQDIMLRQAEVARRALGQR